jgi:hypothetical protein
LADEFATTETLEEILNRIYATHGPDHANQIFDKIMQDIAEQFSPTAERLIDIAVVRAVVEYNSLYSDDVRRRLREVRVVHMKIGQMLDKGRARVARQELKCNCEKCVAHPEMENLSHVSESEDMIKSEDLPLK